MMGYGMINSWKMRSCLKAAVQGEADDGDDNDVGDAADDNGVVDDNY